MRQNNWLTLRLRSTLILATTVVLLSNCALRAQDTVPPQTTDQAPPPKAGTEPRQEINDNPQVDDSAQAEESERWNWFYQATAIGDYHGTFHSPYEGADSLRDTPERDVSITTTLFFGFRLDQNTQVYFNPEIAGGKGFSGTDGIADFPNGEIPRVSSAEPKPYLARLYITHDFGFGKKTEAVESAENQLAGPRPVVRYTITVGRFTVTDFFQNNRYSNDPRSQFESWGTMYNGAWDYPADTRGYTWGWMHEFHTENWSLRYASSLEPKVANGQQLDRRIFRDRGDAFEQERRWLLNKHPGAVRVLQYINHADAGNYAEAIALAQATGTTPSVVATRQIGTAKYGFGISIDQELTPDIGVFSRLGWNDGKTESFAFTAIDRLASGGISFSGRPWHRSKDTAATALTVGGLSAVHAQYLADGGLDFLIGDGRLNYGPEYVWETYYNAKLFPGFFAAFDLQHVANPAYNQDRGPVWVESLRLHIEFGKPDFQKHSQ